MLCALVRSRIAYGFISDSQVRSNWLDLLNRFLDVGYGLEDGRGGSIAAGTIGIAEFTLQSGDLFLQTLHVIKIDTVFASVGFVASGV
jgi:hypothetical protein